MTKDQPDFLALAPVKYNGRTVGQAMIHVDGRVEIQIDTLGPGANMLDELIRLLVCEYADGIKIVPNAIPAQPAT